MIWEAVVMWWRTIVWITGWVSTIIIPVAFYKTVNHVLAIRALKRRQK